MIILKSWRGNSVSIAEAIAGTLDTSDHGSGQLEDLTGNQHETGEMLGKLVEKLYRKGVFSDADIVDLLGWKYTVKEAAE